MNAIYKPTHEFWKEVYPNGMTAEDIGNELTDLAFLIDNVSKIYMHITGGMASKPMIYADVINALHDDFITQTYNDAVKEVIDVIEARTGFDCVRTTWDKGQLDSIKADLIEEIKTQFGVTNG